jgi:WhiB family transcriptional regulator, redox-sensing transcriptional regulator
MRGHPAVPRRSSCAAKTLTVDLGCTGIGPSSVIHYARWLAHRASGVDRPCTRDGHSGWGAARSGLLPQRDGYQSRQARTDRPARTVLEMADTRRLPKPVAHEWDWQLKGSCQGLNSSVFFHPDGERGSARSRRADRAKAICQHCPVLEQCRRYALAAREPYGVWGGLTEEERRELWTGQHQLLVS